MAPAEPRGRTGDGPLLLDLLPPVSEETHTHALMAPFSHFCQVFDSNQNKDKLLRFKVGSGKVIRVSFPVTLEDANGNRFCALKWRHI